MTYTGKYRIAGPEYYWQESAVETKIAVARTSKFGVLDCHVRNTISAEFNLVVDTLPNFNPNQLIWQLVCNYQSSKHSSYSSSVAYRGGALGSQISCFESGCYQVFR